MNLLDRINIVKRIRGLERDYAEKRADLEDLIERHGEGSTLPLIDDWGINRELKKLRQLAGIEEEGQNDE